MKRGIPITRYTALNFLFKFNIEKGLAGWLALFYLGCLAWVLAPCSLVLKFKHSTGVSPLRAWLSHLNLAFSFNANTVPLMAAGA